MLSENVKGWSNLSGLAASGDPNILYAVVDGDLPPPRILRIDISTRAPQIVDAIELQDCEPGLDLEGIVAKRSGGFWLVSEGGENNGKTNLLIEVSDTGKCLRQEKLPDAVRDRIGDRGLEGVALDEVGKVYVAFQAPLTGEEGARIGKFDPDTKEWSFFYYPLDAAKDARVGLSELLYLGANRFAAIERDDQEGGKARIKWITTFELAAAGASGTGLVTKRKAVNLIDYFERDRRQVETQIEGLAVTSRDGVFVLTDDDPGRETLLLYLGTTVDTKLKR